MILPSKMVTELTPAPRSIRATPFSICSSFSTALAVIPGVKYFLAMEMPMLLNMLSMFVECLLFPTNTLKLPSRVPAVIPTMSLSSSFRQSSVEKDWATAP